MKIIPIATGVIVAGLGAVLAATNPDRETYQRYAGDRLTEYLQTEACRQAGNFESLCEDFVEDSQPQLERIIARSTDRQNFLLFSIYRTDLSVPLPGIPEVKSQSLGILNQLHTYELTTQSS